MNIKYKIRGNSGLCKIYTRLYANKIDISCSINLFVEKEYWDSVKEKAKSEEVNLTLQKLKMYLIESFNISYSNGKVIDTYWLKNQVKLFFNRDSAEKSLTNSKSRVYLTHFADFWLENEASNWKVNHKEVLGETVKKQYETFVSLLRDFEHEKSLKLQFENITQETIYQFVTYMETLGYKSSTIKRNVLRLKFFCTRAKELGIKVNESYSKRIYVDQKKKVEDIYFTKEEIDRIVKVDVSHDERLNNIKDYFIIGLFTGLRLSDFLESLSIEDISEDFIEIDTQKTGEKVVIPIHKEVKNVIKRNFGCLPPKVDRNAFNVGIKIICQLAEIDNEVWGYKFCSNSRRKEYGKFKKYELVTSHVCRKSMATIYYGKIPDEVLCSILGWKSNAMLKHYNKSTKLDYAKQFKNFLENE